jgi:hypothetical protein
MPATTKQEMTTTKQEMVVSTSSMRAEADQRSAAAREATRSALAAAAAARAENAKAAQLAYEAGLIDQVQDVQAEYDGASARLSRLEAGVASALAAKRAAEDRRDADSRRLAAREADEKKAEADGADAGQQEELAVRVAKLRKVVAFREADVAKAATGHAGAKAELDTWTARVAGLYAELADAKRKAGNPGPAPCQPGPLDTLGGIFESLVTATIRFACLAADTPGPAPAKPGRAELMRDQTRFRTLNRHVIIPPRMPA